MCNKNNQFIYFLTGIIFFSSNLVIGQEISPEQDNIEPQLVEAQQTTDPQSTLEEETAVGETQQTIPSTPTKKPAQQPESPKVVEEEKPPQINIEKLPTQIQEKIKQLNNQNTMTLSEEAYTIQKSPLFNIMVKVYKPKYKAEYQQEINVLGKLQNYPFAPKLLAKDDSSLGIVTEYPGDPITLQTLPPDWRYQVDYMQAVLQKLGIVDFGITSNTLFIKNGRMIQSDYKNTTPGSSTTKKGQDQQSPLNNPQDISNQYRSIYLAVNDFLGSDLNSAAGLSGIARDKGFPVSRSWVFGLSAAAPTIYGDFKEIIVYHEDKKFSLYLLENSIKDPNFIPVRIKNITPDPSEWGLLYTSIWTKKINNWIDKVISENLRK